MHKKMIFLLSLIIIATLFVSCDSNTLSQNQGQGQNQSQNHSQKAPQSIQHPTYLKGKTLSLSWISGNDCTSGIQAYQASAQADPDAALIGTGWINPTDGTLITGNNNCVVGTPSMDSIINTIHRNNGMAYLTITMDMGAWTPQQAATYINTATTNTQYINNIVQEVTRANYDGVIMDLEVVDNAYPAINQLFFDYNKILYTALHTKHYKYGITLIPKVSPNQIQMSLNAFEDWSKLSTTADFMVIMAVDQSYTTPGPAVSLSWLEQLMTYARQTMPNKLTNIIWELPLYGDTWHFSNNQWVLDRSLTYQEAQNVINKISQEQVDQKNTDTQPVNSPHIVYTDASGIKHALWYPTAKTLVLLIANFKIAEHSNIQFAVWWRTTAEPTDFWSMIDKLY